MPELPDILLYLHALEPRVVGRRVMAVRLASPFLLRSVEPPLSAVEGRTIVGVYRLGKRIAFEAEGDLFLVFHLMIAGRFRWKPPRMAIPGKVGLLALDFEHGTLILTEAGTKRQASLHVVHGRDALERHNPGGLEVLTADLAAFTAALQRENHTLKRALTDPHLFSWIGNAYSDEILHAARLSPFKQTSSLDADEVRGCTTRSA
jgi:formamidopyrimidine-DNA glycosylase